MSTQGDIVRVPSSSDSCNVDSQGGSGRSRKKKIPEKFIRASTKVKTANVVLSFTISSSQKGEQSRLMFPFPA